VDVFIALCMTFVCCYAVALLAGVGSLPIGQKELAESSVAKHSTSEKSPFLEEAATPSFVYPKNTAELDRGIADLLSALGDNTYQKRQEAMKRHSEIGVPALQALQITEEQNAELERRQRAAFLVRSIRQEHGLPRRVSGLEFSLVGSKKWSIPKRGEVSRVQLGLNVNNTTAHDCRVLIGHAIGLFFTDTKGVALPRQCLGVEGGSDQSWQTLPRHGSFTWLIHGRLAWHRDRNEELCFYCDLEGVMWEYAGFFGGRFRLMLDYGNNKERALDGDPLWVGAFELFLDIELNDEKD
jgi:hypothetical protein